MTLPAITPRFSPEDYLAWKAAQQERHEFADGEVLAMSEASDTRVTICGNLLVMLKTQLRGGPCRVLQTDLKRRVAADTFYHPALLVTCDERDRGAAAERGKAHPLLLIEGLSPSTSGYGQGVKFASYRKRLSLCE